MKQITSPNNYGPRKHDVDRVTIHHMAGNMDLDTALQYFAKPSTKAAPNYCIDSSGNVGISVTENMAAWTSSNRDNDHRAVTIEIANDSGAPEWSVSFDAFNAAVELLVDIAERHGKRRLVWIQDKAEALAYDLGPDELLVTVHRWFSNTLCPGPYLLAHMGLLVQAVNDKLKTEAAVYKVQVGAFSNLENARAALEKARTLFPDAFIYKRR